MSAEGYALSDHFDGARFRLPGEKRPPGLLKLLRWKLTTRPARWPAWVEDPRVPPPPPIQEGELAATFVGHATWLLRLGSVTVLTDPVWSERCSPVSFAGPRRVRRPGLAFETLPRVDVTLVSHGHYDHLDLPTLTRIAEVHRPPFVTPLGHAPLLARHAVGPVHEMDWWQTWQGPRGLLVTLVPSRHFSARSLFDRNRALWGGFVLERDGRRIYFAGDSAYGPHFGDIAERLGPFDLALLPIGAYAPRWFMRPVHMDPDEAVCAYADLGSPATLAMHWGTFQLTDEPIDEPVRRLGQACAAAGIAVDRFRVLEHGETVVDSRQRREP
jgi:L-ascorbate metabolism protein UlaG (beta-lactamase superfamily)